MNLRAILPADRTQLGKLQAFHEGSMVAEFPCYGKADNAMAAAKGNPARKTTLPFGDTPTGVWRVQVGKAQEDFITYGPHPVLMLWPLGGDAVKAYSAPNRRNGIWIHGGDLNTAGALRPTYGCLRVHNATMAALHEFTKKYGAIDRLETTEAA